MVSTGASITTRIEWVRKDVEDLLNTAQQTLERYIAHKDAEQLAQCSRLLAQIKGVLSVVGADGASMLARELDLLLKALIDEKVRNPDETCNVLAQGIIELFNYLQHLQDGYKDLPIVILPLLNDLRASRDAELLSEHLVFLPEEEDIDFDEYGIDAPMALAPVALHKAAVKLRYIYQKSLLGWYQDRQAKENLFVLNKVCLNLLRVTHDKTLRSLWCISAALAEALALKTLEGSVTIKQLMGRVEREIKHLGIQEQKKQNVLREEISQELLKNSLYYVAQASSGSQFVDIVKEIWELDIHLPQNEGIARIRQHYSSPGRRLLKTVASSINEDIDHIATSLEEYNEEHPEILLFMIKRMRKIADTLSMLGLNALDQHISVHIAMLKERHKTQKNLSFEDSNELADALLQVRGVLDEYAESGEDLSTQALGEDAENTIIAGHEISTAAYHEINEDIDHVKNQVLSFIENPENHSLLDKAQHNLRNIKGALTLLSDREILPLVNGIQAYIEHLLEVSSVPETQELDFLADVITAVESVVYMLEHGGDSKPLLEIGFMSLQALSTFTGLQLHNIEEEQQSLNELALKKKAKKKKKLKIYAHLKTKQQPTRQSELSPA